MITLLNFNSYLPRPKYHIKSVGRLEINQRGASALATRTLTATTTPQIKNLIGGKRKYKRAARAARSLAQFRPLQNNNMKLPHLHL